MTNTKRIIKGDLVKIISGAKKGTTGKVLSVIAKKNAVLIDGVGVMHRTVKPSRLHPQGGHHDIHVPTPISKVALVVDEKTNKTSRISLKRDENNTKIRVARQYKDKEITSPKPSKAGK